MSAKQSAVDVFGAINSALVYFDIWCARSAKDKSVILCALAALDEAYWRMCALESIEGHIKTDHYVPTEEEQESWISSQPEPDAIEVTV